MGEKHRLWGRDSGRYFLPGLLADLNAGLTIESTVYIQCGSAFRPDGPDELRPVGETEFAAGVAAEAEAAGRARVCAGIVGYCDFRIGDRIDAVLEAHIQAGGGRFKGIRVGPGSAVTLSEAGGAIDIAGRFLDAIAATVSFE